MKRKRQFSDWRDEARSFVNWDIRRAKRILKKGERYLPLDLEVSLMEQGIDVDLLKSKYRS